MTEDQVIKLWFHYEEIAMHFNGIIIQYRLQLMGGAGAIGALASCLIQAKVEHRKQRFALYCFVSFAAFVLLCAAAVLDIFYYNELLNGAVAALLEFEKNHPQINMSTLIHQKASGSEKVIVFVYVLILLPLLLYAGYALGRWSAEPDVDTSHQD